MRNYGIPLFFSKMALHGGGHLELKKCTRGIFGASSEFVWGDVHVSFLKKSGYFLCHRTSPFPFISTCVTGCGSSGILDLPTVITSPGYPFEYNDHSYCTWRVDGLPGTQVSVHFFISFIFFLVAMGVCQ